MPTQQARQKTPRHLRRSGSLLSCRLWPLRSVPSSGSTLRPRAGLYLRRRRTGADPNRLRMASMNTGFLGFPVGGNRLYYSYSKRQAALKEESGPRPMPWVTGADASRVKTADRSKSMLIWSLALGWGPAGADDRWRVSREPDLARSGTAGMPAFPRSPARLPVESARSPASVDEAAAERRE